MNEQPDELECEICGKKDTLLHEEGWVVCEECYDNRVDSSGYCPLSCQLTGICDQSC